MMDNQLSCGEARGRERDARSIFLYTVTVHPRCAYSFIHFFLRGILIRLRKASESVLAVIFLPLLVGFGLNFYHCDDQFFLYL